MTSKLFHNQSPRRYGMGPGSNSRPMDLQSDSVVIAIYLAWNLHIQMEHSAIRSTFIKLPFVIKICVLPNFEWPLKTGFTVPMHTFIFLKN